MADEIRSEIKRTFGEHIGDSKYDRWHTGDAMMMSDFEQMTDDQLFANLTKDNIFPKPDYEKLQAEGIDPVVLYYRKALRDSLPSNPKSEHYYYSNPHGAYEDYFRLVSAARDECEKIKTIPDMEKSGINWMLERGFVTKGYNVMIQNPYASRRFVTLAMKSGDFLFFLNERIKKGFLMTREEKILSHYTFPAMDKNTMTIESSSWSKGSKTYLRYEFAHGITKYIYPDKGIDMDKLKSDLENETGYLVVQGHSLKAYGFQTLEMAEKWAIAQESDEPAKTTARKKRYVPKELSHIDQTDHSIPILCMDKTGEDLMQTFGFRGGEFGEYESQKERQTNLNMCYIAFHDLATALGIDDTDVSLGHDLAIAFGARGRGAAMAHFEPVKNVINLTKLKGAGSLSHEWIHALDHAIGVAIAQKLGRPGTAAFATDNHNMYLQQYSDFPALGKLMEALEYKKTPDKDYFIHTDFYNNAVEMDKVYQKEHGNYWSDPVELLARAGACYIKDKCEEMGICDDYLSGHAEGEMIAPHGEERKLFNTYFDAMLEEVKERGILHLEEGKKRGFLHDADKDLEESRKETL